MSQIAIKVENLSKAYQLGQIGTGTISRDLERWYARMRGKEDPFLRIGENNHQNTRSASDVVWSLKDINFEIEQGDAVGIIGRNGAGKSTLLKILSKVTAPTTGRISGKGRIASLLEVGTGFHPELSGRENIFLNGTILGMRKKEIQRKLEEIVDFAGIERYLDTPVKRYSSGMYVRLAFAVAAHLESEILIVDEVLAVGDTEFQKKCLGKMGEVSKGEGRTVLFVSHNMDAIATLTDKSIYLKNGKLKSYSNTETVIQTYLQTDVNEVGIYIKEPKVDRPSITRAQVGTSELNGFHMNGKDLLIDLEINMPEIIEGMAISLQISNPKELPIIYTYVFDTETNILRKVGINKVRCTIPNCKLYADKYYLVLHLAESKGRTKFEEIHRICEFEVIMPNKIIEWGWQKNVCVYTENFSWVNL
ncbi:polysaccharide ABC transporter ATP-binding protein [Pedobacter sp. CFBP9032]|uniref:ABC transporter ATP-binding protein n=1 Tax=Pedobacter sp. CFBP9032 TaxID=3096539 RepID=UPI002A6B00F4|nr:polysaccharide ABC transporter ATP-binding protein [Pedobacter sp. CFBP9032]MDY0907440.1 polysaccharide ABC transporter ATP-binding protein [Pedobacter sp. CFBP9032]